MHYITGRYALNLPCGLKTPGDWHFYALDWSKVIWADSADSVWGDYGIELHNDVPGQTGEVGVANHIRALLDLIAAGAFPVAWGMRENYLNNDALAPEVFAKVWLLHVSPNWDDVDHFMVIEYLSLWLQWKQKVLGWTPPEPESRNQEGVDQRFAAQSPEDLDATVSQLIYRYLVKKTPCDLFVLCRLIQLRGQELSFDKVKFVYQSLCDETEERVRALALAYPCDGYTAETLVNLFLKTQMALLNMQRRKRI